MAEQTWNDAWRAGVYSFIGTALFPRVAHWLRWPTRLGPEGFVAYAAANALLIFVVHTRVLPWAKRMAEERSRAERELRDELGRDPTEYELLARLGFAFER